MFRITLRGIRELNFTLQEVLEICSLNLNLCLPYVVERDSARAFRNQYLNDWGSC